MARTIQQYLTKNPLARKRHMQKTATAEKIVNVGWAWNPDEETKRALARGNRKIRKAKLDSQTQNEEETQMSTSKATKKVTKKVTKKTTAKKVGKKKASNLVPLKKLCSVLKIDTKLARRKLRADKAMAKIHATKGRWEFTDAQAKQARKVLAA